MKILKKAIKKKEIKDEKIMGGAEKEFVSKGFCTVCAGSIGTDDNLNIFSTSDCTHYPKA